MRAEVTRRYSFEAGHWLPKVREGHKCKRKHGHNYVIEISVEGEVDDVGFVIDFWDLDKIIDPIIARVDHRMLNDIEGLENPTAEHIGFWFVKQIITAPTEIPFLLVTKVRVYETENCYADIRP